MTGFKFPTLENIIEVNKLALREIKVKKADKPKLLSYTALKDSIDNCKKMKGDVYDKAACILKNLIQKHPFASGNRRTAFIVAEDFLLSNKATTKLKNEKRHAKALTGIREGYYKDDEIKNWLKEGEIREFKRGEH